MQKMVDKLKKSREKKNYQANWKFKKRIICRYAIKVTRKYLKKKLLSKLCMRIDRFYAF